MTFLLGVAAAGCSSDGSTGVTGLRPPATLSRAVAVEPLITGEVLASLLQPRIDQLLIGMMLLNGLSESITSDACAEAVDARAVNAENWSDVTAASRGCPFPSQRLQPGGSALLNILADRAKLRTVAGGAGKRVIVRVRTIVSGENRSYAMMSAEQQVTAP